MIVHLGIAALQLVQYGNVIVVDILETAHEIVVRDEALLLVQLGSAAKIDFRIEQQIATSRRRQLQNLLLMIEYNSHRALLVQYGQIMPVAACEVIR